MIEFMSATRRLLFLNQIDDFRAAEALQFTQQLKIHSFDTAGIAVEIWSLRQNFSVYDAGYVALANILGTTLLTSDKRLRSAALAHTGVHVI